MIAVKVHKFKKVSLRKGTFWVPIQNWKNAKIHLGNWYRLLKKQRGVGALQYVTLIRIPPKHRVHMADDWIDYFVEVDPRFSGLSQESIFRPMHEQSVDEFRWAVNDFGMRGRNLPQLVLGESLPPECVIWTKDVRLLFMGDRRNRARARE